MKGMKTTRNDSELSRNKNTHLKTQPASHLSVLLEHLKGTDHFTVCKDSPPAFFILSLLLGIRLHPPSEEAAEVCGKEFGVKRGGT